MLRIFGRFKLKTVNFKTQLTTVQLLNYSSQVISIKHSSLYNYWSSAKNLNRIDKYQYFCQQVNVNHKEIDEATFDRVCNETLESLLDYFEELIETNEKFKSADVSYSSGVLTVNLDSYGTYVINRQTPNKQVWLSSPKSGPKRYDYIQDGSYWVYKHDYKTLHQLLESELSDILGLNIDLSKCTHYK